MKTCDEMVKSLLKRREQFFLEQKQKRRTAICTHNVSLPLKRRTDFMKKIILTGIIAAVLGIGGGVTAVLLNRSNTAVANDVEGDFVDLEVKSGTYYLNGDKNAELWIEVNPEFLILKGTDVDKSLMDMAIKTCEEDSEDPTEEGVNYTFEHAKELFCAEKLYVVQYVNLQYPYMICVSRDNSVTDRSELKEKKKTAVFPYDNKTNAIQLGTLGDFILVE